MNTYASISTGGGAAIQGPPGEDGLSAYEVWLAQGNTGNEAAYIASLRGIPGPPGTGNGITDGDKGDVIVSGNGAVWTVKGAGILRAEEFGVVPDFKRIDGVDVTVAGGVATLERIVEKFATMPGTANSFFYSDPNGAGDSICIKNYTGDDFATDFAIGSRLAFVLESAPELEYDFGLITAIVGGPPFGFYDAVIKCTNPNGYHYNNVQGPAAQYEKPLVGILKFQPVQIPFTNVDVGKVLVIDDARNWPQWGGLCPANVKITAAADGRASIIDVDNGLMGSLVNCTNKQASYFTENTDKLVAAVNAQVDQGYEYLQLPIGDVGVMPFISQAWVNAPILDGYAGYRAIFSLLDLAHIKGSGNLTSKIKIEYFGEFIIAKADDNDAPGSRLAPTVFQYIPIANRVTSAVTEDFTLELPTHLPTVFSGYTIFSDTHNGLPARHALQANINRVRIIGGTTSQLIKSNHGGMYDSDSNAIETMRWIITDSPEIQAATIDIKNNNDQVGGKTGGKEFLIDDSNFKGGKLIQRYYRAKADYKTGPANAYNYLEIVDEPGFSWGIFNRIFNEAAFTQFVFRPDCLIGLGLSRTIANASLDALGNVTINLQSAFGVNKTNCIVMCNFISHEQSSGFIYCEAIAIEDDATSIYLPASFLHILPEDVAAFAPQVAALAGKECRIIYDQIVVSTVYPWVNGKRIKVAPGADESLLDMEGLDIICNYTAPNTFHWTYVSHNLLFRIRRSRVDNVISRIFRTSVGANPDAGVQTKYFEDFIIGRSVGAVNSMGRRGTAYQPDCEMLGLNYITRTKMTSVLPCAVIVDNGLFRGNGGFGGNSVVKNNSEIYGTLLEGGVLTATDSIVGISSVRRDNAGNAQNEIFDAISPRLFIENCTINLGLNNGLVNLKECTGIISVNENRGVRIIAKNTKFTRLFLNNSNIQVLRDNSYFENCGLEDKFFTAFFGLSNTESKLLDISDEAKTMALPVYAGPDYTSSYGVFREPGVAKSYFYGVFPGNFGNSKNAVFIDGVYGRYTLPACTIEDIIFNSVRAGATIDTWRPMEDYYSAKATVEFFCQGSVTFRNSHSLKVISQRPRLQEKVIFRWVPAGKYWEEVPASKEYVSTVAPGWAGGDNETVKGTGNVLFYKCLHQVATDYTYMPLNNANGIPMHLGFQNVVQESALQNIQYTTSTDVDVTAVWQNFTSQYKGALFAPEGVVYPDDKSGYAGALYEAPGTAGVGTITGVRYKRLLGQQWQTILNSSGGGSSTSDITHTGAAGSSIAITANTPYKGIIIIGNAGEAVSLGTTPGDVDVVDSVVLDATGKYTIAVVIYYTAATTLHLSSNTNPVTIILLS